MKYTMLYLKILVIVILLILTVVLLLLGVICLGLGIFGAAGEQNPRFLVFIPAGVFCGFAGFVALDSFKYLMDKWGIKDI